MHIWLIQTGETLPFLTGEQRTMRTARLARTLAAAGHQVVWWTANFSHQHKQPFVPIAQGDNQVLTVAPGLQVRLLHGCGYQRNISLQRLRHNRMIAQAFAQQARAMAQMPDVLLCGLPTLELCEQAVSFAHRQRIPAIIDIRDPWPDLYLMPVTAIGRPVARLLLTSEFERVRRVCQQATAITATSETYLAWALHYAQRSRQPYDNVFPIGDTQNTAECSLPTPAAAWPFLQGYPLPADRLLITYVGTLGTSYDLATVVRVAQALQARGDNRVQCVFTGDTTQGQGPVLRKQATGLQNVSFVGWLEQPQLRALLSVSGAGLVPYAGHALQSLPNKPFEYMAAGIPLVSSLGGELAILLEQEQIGRQYQAGNTASLLDQITWLLAHPHERQAMGQRARALLERNYRAEGIYPRFAEYLVTIAAAT